MKARKTTYFDKPGQQNTEAALNCAIERLKEKDLEHVVVASYSGKTALELAKKLKVANMTVKLVAVTVYAGFRHEAPKEFKENLKKIKALGFQAEGIRAAHALSGAERALQAKYQGVYPLLLMADTLRLFSQGVKVCAEIALMAADAAKISSEKNVLTIAGSAGGADTVMVLKPAISRNVFDLNLEEIVCKPIVKS